MIITVQHCREMKYCVRGLRHWCQLNNVDFRDFLKNGIAEEKLAEFDDHMAKALIAHANKSEVSHGR